MKKISLFLVALALTALCACAALADGGVVILPADTTVIEDEAFRNLTSISEFQLPATVTQIGAGAFRDCGDPSGTLRYYFAPDGMTVGADAFANCRAVIKLNGSELPHLTYTMGNDGVTITGISGQPTEVTIPDSISGKPVVAIGNNAFKGRSSMTNVVIPATVTSLGSGAFRDCSSLTEITLPAGITALPASVFQGAGKLQHVVLQGNLTAIGADAFNDCYALVFDIPATVTQLGANAFRYCRSLSEVTVPSGITALPDDVFLYCSSLQSVRLPEELKSIGKEAFYGCTALEEINLPAGLTSLGSGVFCNCPGLSSISLPAGITELPSRTFQGCTALSEIDLPTGLTGMGSNVFNGCSALTSISLPEGITELPNEAFNNANGLKTIQLPTGLTTLGTGVFYNCRSLTSVSLPEGITTLPNNTFYNCYALEEVHLPTGLSSLGARAFCYCDALREIDLPAGITSLPNEVFRGCSALTQIDLSGITSLGNGALRACASLTEVTIPEGVTLLPESLFEDATGLTQVHLPGTLNTINNYAFYHCESLTEVSIPGGVTAIPGGAFRKCAALQSVQLPAGLESIAGNAFRECTRLTRINFPSGLTSIGQEAFRDSCVGQSDNAVYILPDSVETFGSNAFYNCGAGLLVESGSDREDFVKANGYTFAYDADDGFRYQYKKVSSVDTLYLVGYKGASKNVTIPAGPEIIGEDAFADNSAITEVTIPEGVTKIDNRAFRYCTALARVAMPDSVTDIGNSTFAYCAKLTDVAFSQSLHRIGSDAFDYACTEAGTHFYRLPDQITTLDWTPFSDCGAVLCFGRGSDSATLFRKNNYIYTYTGETDFRYRWYSGEGTQEHQERLLQYTGSAATVEIPACVWLIDDEAFRDNTTMTKVVIPEGVTRLGNNAFRDCVNLTDVTFPGTLTGLWDNAFYGCGSAAQAPFCFSLPDNIGEVRANVFTDCPAILLCGLNTTTADKISNSGWTFARNDRPDELDIRYKYGYANRVWSLTLYDYVGPLTSIRLPDDCPNADSAVLGQKVNDGLELVCGQLSETALGLSNAGLTFTFPGHEGLRYRIIDNVLYLMGCVGSPTELIIPRAAAYVDAGWDEQVRKNCFQNLTALTTLVLPEGVTRLNDNAFSGCTNLTDITLPNSLKSMGQKIFRYAGQNLTEPFYLVLPDYMEDVGGNSGGANSFEDLFAVLMCGKTSQTAGLLTDRNWAYTVRGEEDFRYRYIACTEGGETGRRLWLVGYEGDDALVTIPEGIYGIRSFNNNTTSSNWPTFHGWGFRDNTTVTSVVIPEGTVEIEDSAFRGCLNLTDITFPGTLKILKSHAFEQCGKNAAWLHYYVLPDDMEEISTNTDAGWGAFTDINMGRIVCDPNGETAQILSGNVDYNPGGTYSFALKGYETDGLLYKYMPYKDADNQTVYRLELRQYEGTASAVTIPDDCGLYAIADSAFAGHSELQSISIPEGVVSIGNLAFSGCTALRGSCDFTWTDEGGEVHTESNIIRLPDSLKTLGSGAFREVGSAVADRFYLYLPAGLEALDVSSVLYRCNAVLVAPGGAAATALYNGWYYCYPSLQDAILGTNCVYQKAFDENGIEIEHVHYGRR